MSPEARARTIATRFALLGLLAALAVAGFMLLGARGSWSFILPFRGTKLAGLVLVAVAIGTATVVFQTITNNRILTPSIMGFDALYILLQTALVFSLGAMQTSMLDARAMFLAETALLLIFGGLLYYWLFGATARSLHLLLLVGIVFGVFFRAISGLLQRIMDPGEFLVLQDRMFASFNTVNQELLVIAALIVGAVCLGFWRLHRVFDVLALGREAAIGLGVAHARMVALALVLVTVLVAVSTALVGPISFFGLLVANLAYLLFPTARHAVLLPAATLIGLIALVGGQTILEQVLSYDTALSVVIEFIGGIAFILLVVRGGAR
ncbi:iron chelate uptake ABC transporter family permease subunit [Pararhodobacter sp.]|uniref:iron chelate uptake ABC transporter family permease subunit n=1 Tax=Pararhodobacter sp. TaxID=2127056 RepID=UPI002FDE507B